MTSAPRPLWITGLPLAAALVLVQCRNSGEPTRAQGADAASDPAADACCDIAPGTGLDAAMGRVVVSYPEDEAARTARLDVYRAGDADTPLGGGWGDQSIALAPGSYDVLVNGKRVAGVGVQAGHDTRVRVGVLHVYAGDATRIDLLDPVSGDAVTGGYGEKSYGLPVGPIGVQVAGQAEAVLIEDGRITDF